MQHHTATKSAGHPVWLLVAFWFSVAIALSVVIRRLVEFVRPSQSGPPMMLSLNAAFSSHAVLTAAHIIPAAIFVLLAAAILLGNWGGAWSERSFFLFGAATAATAYAMSRYAVGGWLERSAVLVFDSWFLISLARAYWFRLHGEPTRKREWMARAVGILLGIATTRPVMGLLFATSSRTHLGPGEFFGIAFWLGFSINTAATELWLRSNRRAQLRSIAG